MPSSLPEPFAGVELAYDRATDALAAGDLGAVDACLDAVDAILASQPGAAPAAILAKHGHLLAAVACLRDATIAELARLRRGRRTLRSYRVGTSAVSRHV